MNTDCDNSKEVNRYNTNARKREHSYVQSTSVVTDEAQGKGKKHIVGRKERRTDLTVVSSEASFEARNAEDALNRCWLTAARVQLINAVK